MAGTKNEGEKIFEYLFVQIIMAEVSFKGLKYSHSLFPLFRCSMYLLQVKYFFLASKITFIETFSEFLFLFAFSAQKVNKYQICLDQGMIKAPEMGWNFMLIIQPLLWYLSFSRAPLCMISRLLWHGLLSLLMSQKIAPSQSWVQNLN